MSSSSSSPEAAAYSTARELIDAAHRKDPAYLSRNAHSDTCAPATSHRTTGPSHTTDELSYADAVESWAVTLVESNEAGSQSDLLSGPGGLELIRLAARCQHLERFLTPRSSYPEGKAGYLKWRRDLYTIQADRAKELLLSAGVPLEQAELVHKWVSKTDLKPGKEGGDKGTQLLEDAAVLVFLEDELANFAAQHSDYTREKYIDILKKTWRKLSNQGKAAARTLQMPPGLGDLVAEATGGLEEESQKAGVGGEDLVGRAEALSVSETSGTGSSPSKDANSQTTMRTPTSSNYPSNGSSDPKKSSSSLPYVASGRPKTAAEAQALLDENGDAGASETIFGARLLKEQDGEEVWEHNAWDHVEPPPEHMAMINELLAKQAETKVSEETAAQYHANAASYWDTFYSRHEHRFFRDRKWLHLEFPELVQSTLEDAPPVTIVEVGCGAGNTVFPLLEMNKNPRLVIHACDYSAEAVGVVRSNPLYANPPTGICRANVWDLSSTRPRHGEASEVARSPASTPSNAPLSETEPNLPDGVEPGSVDIVVMIFVLSALHPREWAAAVRNVRTMLRPKTGLVLLRDYGRHDLPQLRFRKGRMLDDNFYVRGDGTRVYFFTPEELSEVFGAEASSSSSSTLNDVRSSLPDEQASPEAVGESSDAGKRVKEEGEETKAGKTEQRFETVQMAVDRRLLVNRKERKRMYRVWMQAKFRKL